MPKSIVVRRNPSAIVLNPAAARQLQERISTIQVVCAPVNSIKPNPRNAKQHPDKQIRLLAENFRQFGYTQPVLVDETNTILAGHARFEAVRLLKLDTIPVIQVGYLTSQEKRALALADNKLAELGNWDLQSLSSEFKVLCVESEVLSFDYSIIGFDTAEIDHHLYGDTLPTNSDPADEVPLPLLAQAPVTVRGDVWICGNHRLLCGNALDAAAYRTVLGGEKADIVFTDPPYDALSTCHLNPCDDGEDSGDVMVEATEFLQTAFGRIADSITDGAVIYVECGEWQSLSKLCAATAPNFGDPKDIVVWVKANSRQGSFYRSQHELIVVFVAGRAAATKNFGLNGRGRYRSNVWQYPGSTSRGRGRDLLRFPSGIGPVAMIADALRDCSKRHAVVLDPYGGHGTTLISAERTDRRARLIEIEPSYCDIAVQRWEMFSGKHSCLVETNETFAEVATRRRAGKEAQE